MTVSDMGIGMSDEVVARLGEAFYQAESSADRRYEGTGLGLSIVKGLVELHDGRMDIKSAPGKGTSVTISLPINGPETKSGDSDVISVLKDQRTPTEEAAWSEPKRRAL